MKPATRVTHKSTGPAAPAAMNTAPAPYPEQGIAGFARLKPASQAVGPSGPGTATPRKRASASGYNAPSDSPPSGSLPGGPSRAGPRGTQGGTSSPKHGPGPSGLGEAGSKFPPIG